MVMGFLTGEIYVDVQVVQVLLEANYSPVQLYMYKKNIRLLK